MAGLERRLAPWRVRSAGQSPGANAEAATSSRFYVTTLLRKRFPRKAQRAGPRASGRRLPAESHLPTGDALTVSCRCSQVASRAACTR